MGVINFQIFTPTFFDSNGDGIGDFSGIRLMIEKVRRTGIKTILVSPVLSIEKVCWFFPTHMDKDKVIKCSKILLICLIMKSTDLKNNNLG